MRKYNDDIKLRKVSIVQPLLLNQDRSEFTIFYLLLVKLKDSNEILLQVSLTIKVLRIYYVIVWYNISLSIALDYLLGIFIENLAVPQQLNY